MDKMFNVSEVELREKFMIIAERFVEYLNDGDFDKNFDFVMNDGSCDFNFGIASPHMGFGNWVFITSMYGDGSGTTATLLVIENINGIEESWDYYLDYITDYLFSNYNGWIPVI